MTQKSKGVLEKELEAALSENADLKKSLDNSESQLRVAKAKIAAFEDIIKTLPIGGQTIHIDAKAAVNIGNASAIDNSGGGMNSTSTMFKN